MSGMSTEIFAEYMHLEAAKEQRVVDYIEELAAIGHSECDLSQGREGAQRPHRQEFSPDGSELDAALAQVKLLKEAGDAETRKSLSALVEALPGYRDEDPTGVANDGRRAVLDSLANLADRCQAVGSPTLQWVG